MSSVYNKLTQIALEDEVITEEEATLLETILSSIEKYNDVLENALEDGIITENEQNGLLQAREAIYQSAYSTAMEDEKLSADEIKLLESLTSILKQLS